MPKLTAPSLPPGPRQALSLELHALHRRAGWPSVRDLSSALGDGVASPSRIHDAFTKPRLPAWGLIDVLVVALARKIPRADPTAEVERFHALWDAASDVPTAPVGSPPAGAERDIPPPPPLTVAPPSIPPSLENDREDRGPAGLADAVEVGILTAQDAETVLRRMIASYDTIAQDRDRASAAELEALDFRDLLPLLRTKFSQDVDTTELARRVAELTEQRDRAVEQALRDREAGWRSTDPGAGEDLLERMPMPLDHPHPYAPEPEGKGPVSGLFDFVRRGSRDSEDDMLRQPQFSPRVILEFQDRLDAVGASLGGTWATLEAKQAHADSYQEESALFDKFEDCKDLNGRLHKLSEGLDRIMQDGDREALDDWERQLRRIEFFADELRRG
ncbi:hypothetical protein [Streptomyces sp. E-08]|uniref:hypothetical protein n=1 Tax=Streptomyces sp. E-08 TaxID=3404047 RepID=UPI003CEBF84F